MGIRSFVISSATAALILPGFIALDAQELGAIDSPHAECSFFGPQRERFASEARQRYALSAVTDQVSRQLALTATIPHDADSDNLVDQYIFAALKSASVTPAGLTNDYEFIRRVTLDLTGRIPAPDKVVSFVANKAANKRTSLVDELLATPEWADKWTMFFGDQLKNTANRASLSNRMFDDGRNAFYLWIKDSLSKNKPYDQMVREILSVRGDNSYQTGPINFFVGNRVNNGPAQDTYDQQAAAIAETFLGLAHVNCLECHNGRGHLDQLSLWGRNASRYQAWQLSAFVAKSNQRRVNYDATNPNVYYWSMIDNPNGADYQLNTTNGNRPARVPSGTERNVAPNYFFTNKTVPRGENYRDALARELTADPQFARATVNYIWKQLFGRGIVEPANQFDPDRLDPDNPPPAPWTLQPSNARLLNALASYFVAQKFDLKALIKLLATSQAYQLSSRYSGAWDSHWEPLFARKLVRRLWGEEIADALAQASGVPAAYTITGIGQVNWAMQSPEPGAIRSAFLTNFMPGNRDDEERRGDGSAQQAMALMNDATVMTRTRSSGSGVTASLLARAVAKTDDEAIDMLYLNVLSRYPSDAERTTSRAALKTGNRTNAASDLLWSLFNKVDFVFNY